MRKPTLSRSKIPSLPDTSAFNVPNSPQLSKGIHGSITRETWHPFSIREWNALVEALVRRTLWDISSFRYEKHIFFCSNCIVYIVENNILPKYDRYVVFLLKIWGDVNWHHQVLKRETFHARAKSPFSYRSWWHQWISTKLMLLFGVETLEAVLYFCEAQVKATFFVPHHWS